jgi:hypothetical protein
MSILLSSSFVILRNKTIELDIFQNILMQVANN